MIQGAGAFTGRGEYGCAGWCCPLRKTLLRCSGSLAPFAKWPTILGVFGSGPSYRHSCHGLGCDAHRPWCQRHRRPDGVASAMARRRGFVLSLGADWYHMPRDACGLGAGNHIGSQFRRSKSAGKFQVAMTLGDRVNVRVYCSVMPGVLPIRACVATGVRRRPILNRVSGPVQWFKDDRHPVRPAHGVAGCSWAGLCPDPSFGAGVRRHVASDSGPVRGGRRFQAGWPRAPVARPVSRRSAR